LCEEYAAETCTSNAHVDWQTHDFGYRGCSSEETAALSGAAHLINFRGTDTVPAVAFLKKEYDAKGLIGASVPASEHSVMCSYGREGELEAFRSMLSINPTGIVSIVSDTYDYFNVLTNTTETLREEILGRDGKVVFRPDSGDPEKIICGDPDAPEGSPERKGSLVILAEKFGTTTNEKGFKELNPKVGLIYGDGMYFERFKRILANMKSMGFASSNLVIGVGGLLLQQHSRDDMGFAIKATQATVNGEVRDLIKDPATDPDKRSLSGLLRLDLIEGKFVTTAGVSVEEEKGGLLEPVFYNGVILRKYSLDEVRRNAYGK
jgi:nicotinamide phosphoribosyltransferase